MRKEGTRLFVRISWVNFTLQYKTRTLKFEHLQKGPQTLQRWTAWCSDVLTEVFVLISAQVGTVQCLSTR